VDGDHGNERHVTDAESQRLIEGARTLGVTLSPDDAAKLLRLLDDLARWNRTHNLTAITKRDDMITRHLLDSLSVHAELLGQTVADVGTGGGFPGLPLAVANPERRFTLIDSNHKKIRFVAHAVRELGLTNVEAMHVRVEALQPEVPFDTVIARAFAPLPEMLEKIAPVCGPRTRVLAMKGKRPEEEIANMPEGWRLSRTAALEVPGLPEARCLLVLERKRATGLH
jgi:16S rRNA (guanine527-N7)-methyltransferase